MVLSKGSSEGLLMRSDGRGGLNGQGCARSASRGMIGVPKTPPPPIFSTALQVARSLEISLFQFGQQFGSFGLGSSLPHDCAAVDRLTLARGFRGRSVW